MKITNLAMFAISYPFRNLKLNYSPFFIWVEPTNHCNLKCVTCPQGIGYKAEKGYMNIEAYKKVLAELTPFSPMMISLHLGGEPLLHPALPEMIRLAKQSGFEVTFASNAALLTSERAEEVVKAGVDGITVNFSPDKDNFEKNYKGTKWDLILGNIRHLLEMKKSEGWSKPIFSIQLLSEDSGDDRVKKDIASLKSLFSGLPYNSIVNVTMHNWSGDYADKVAGAGGIKRDRKGYTPCSHLWSSMVIRWNGDVVPCCRDLQGDMLLGNINQEGLAEIWNNEKSVDMRKKHREFRYNEIPICRNCSRVWEGTTIGSLIMRQLSKIPLMITSRFLAKIAYKIDWSR